MLPTRLQKLLEMQWKEKLLWHIDLRSLNAHPIAKFHVVVQRQPKLTKL